jgi:xanthine/uracil permease
VAGTIYLLSVLEAVGALTATAIVSHRPVEGEEYTRRLSGGVLADACSAQLSAFFKRRRAEKKAAKLALQQSNDTLS